MRMPRTPLRDNREKHDIDRAERESESNGVGSLVH
jgi:hypothetical protein